MNSFLLECLEVQLSELRSSLFDSADFERGYEAQIRNLEIAEQKAAFIMDQIKLAKTELKSTPLDKRRS